jgi:dTDP-4-dehydrorhamnose reductase
MFHDEQSSALSNSPLARAAIAMEAALEGSGALVVRTHAYGWSPREDDLSFAERVWLGLTEGLPHAADPHACATPILAADLAQRLYLAYERQLRGLYHIAGAERTSAARFAGELASLAGLPLPRRESPLASHGLSASENLRETSLNTRRARCDLDYPMPMLCQGLAGLLDQLRDGTRDRLCGRLASRSHAEAA